MNVASEINAYLKRNGIKQAYIADKTGIRRDALCTTLNGKRKLVVDEYCQICDALDVPFTQFINQSEGETAAI